MRASILMICAGISYWVVQLTNCEPRKPVITQRMVQVYVMAPEGNSVIWEERKTDELSLIHI